ncbi:MAG: hypothetical protein J5775_03810 [Spirochaetales bacterium]|nr:hypothetical protein [Spirochaetales bacterium]
MRSKLFSKMLYNWQVKVLCFLLAVFIYFVLVFSIQTTRTVTLPVEVKLPASYKADSTIPTEIDLVLQGTEDQIYLIDASKITLSVDFSHVNREGVNFADIKIDTGSLGDYVDLSAISIYTQPSQMKVYFSAQGAAQ